MLDLYTQRPIRHPLYVQYTSTPTGRWTSTPTGPPYTYRIVDIKRCLRRMRVPCHQGLDPHGMHEGHGGRAHGCRQDAVGDEITAAHGGKHRQPEREQCGRADRSGG